MKKIVWAYILLAGLTATITSCMQLPSRTHAQRSVEIFRDRYGMAHLYAATEEAGYYGVGYALGEDRLLQVLTWYVAVRGELAKSFGPVTPRLLPEAPSPLEDAVASDMQARKYRYLEVARSNLDRLPDQYQKNLRAYIEGIKAFMAEHPERVPDWAPTLEPALPLALFHLYVQEARSVCASRRQFDESNARRTASVGRESPYEGSNAWVVSGSRTEDGGVTFSADSHGPIDAHGNVFYPYRIKAGKLDFMAIEPTGTATFLFGHSSRFAWGVTEGPRFVADCYRIKLSSANPGAYTFDGATHAIERAPYTIEVKGASPVNGVFEYTRHNSVKSPVEIRTSNSVYVVSSAQAERMGLGAGQYYQMARARTRAELESAMETGDLYPANLLIGGADGTIMFVRPGGIPIRPPGLDARGTLDGNTSATAWQGMHSYRDLIKLIDPPAGYIANTNVSPDMMYEMSPLIEKDFPAYFGFETGRTNERQRRLLEILKDGRRMTDDAAKACVLDETVPVARKWGPKLELALAAISVDMSQKSSDVQACVQQLVRFDGEFSRSSHAALYHIELLRTLAAKRESFEQLSRGIEKPEPLDHALQEVLVNGAVDACANLQKKYGRTDLSLGDVFRVGRGSVDLPVGSGQIPGVGVATLRALRFGSPNQSGIQRVTGGQRAPFLVHFAPTGVRAYGQMLFGVSDNPESGHFSDQAQLASDKLLPEIPLTREALVKAGATVRHVEVNRH